MLPRSQITRNDLSRAKFGTFIRTVHGRIRWFLALTAQLTSLILTGATASGAQTVNSNYPRSIPGHAGSVPVQRFSVQRQDEGWWLVAPDGRRFFSLGVCCVNRGFLPEQFDAES